MISKKKSFSVVFYFSILFLFSSNANADICDASNVKNKEQLEVVQNCLISQLQNIESILGEIKSYGEDAEMTLRTLINEEALCKEAELVYNENKSIISDSSIISDCKLAREIRLVAYDSIVTEFNKMKPKVEELEARGKAIAIKSKLLKSTAELFNFNKSK